MYGCSPGECSHQDGMSASCTHLECINLIGSAWCMNPIYRIRVIQEQLTHPYRNWAQCYWGTALIPWDAPPQGIQTQDIDKGPWQEGLFGLFLLRWDWGHIPLSRVAEWYVAPVSPQEEQPKMILAMGLCLYFMFFNIQNMLNCI